MKITQYAITKRTAVYVLTLLIVVGGMMAYQKLGRLEFPNFTIKTAVIATRYPGATSLEVEEEVTDPLEQAVQEMSQVKEIRSVSKSGISLIYVDIKESFMNKEMPQIWDELRRKVSDKQIALPTDAGPSLVNDDFGDEFGIFFAITGDGFTYNEIKNYADALKKELLLVEDVASVELWGDQQEVIYLEYSPSRLSELGISMKSLIDTINSQNRLVSVGKVRIGDAHVSIRPSGAISAVEDLGELLIKSDDKGNVVYLKDIVTIHKGLEDPAGWLMRYNGRPAVGLGISTVSDGNVVAVGSAVRKRLSALESERPLGMELHTIAYQADAVSQSVGAFIINLIEAVIIVIAVLCLAMGLESGILMGVILMITILATFLIMQVMGINLQLISLGALILSLGMLVDNAIVVTEGILVRLQQGVERQKAALQTVSQTALPLLGATLVAILAFAAIGTSTDSTGEFLGSLFKVMAISLGLSWILAITLIPLFAIQFLKNKNIEERSAPYDRPIYLHYRRALNFSVRHKIVAMGMIVGVLIFSVWGLRYVEESFFPGSSRPQFMIDYLRPEGTHIEKVSEDLKKLEAYLGDHEYIEGTTAFIGQGALRFLLTYEPEMQNSSYGQLLVTVSDYKKIDDVIHSVRKFAVTSFPDAEIMFQKFTLGPGSKAKVEARFSGPDAEVLRELSRKTQKIIAKNPKARDIRDDWRQPVRIIQPKISEAIARRSGITRPQVAAALTQNYSGKRVGTYREENTLIPMVMRAKLSDKRTIEGLKDISLFSSFSGKSISMGQIVTDIGYSWENPIIKRRDRKRTIAVQCNPSHGNASVLFNEVRKDIESIELPSGYSLVWGGEYENSTMAQESLLKMVPVFLIAMIFIVLTLFNAIRQTCIIFLTLPLAIIGIAAGLLITGEPFGFMCLLGFLGLSGMLIKNAVVLIDQIDLEIASGKDRFNAILDSSVSRLRPVMMAAVTTVLGMLPLVTDSFYSGMSITIIGGLTFGTVLTLIVVPTMYAIFFNISPSKGVS